MEETFYYQGELKEESHLWMEELVMNIRHQDQTRASSLDEEGRERERIVDAYLVIHCSDDTWEKVLLLDKGICFAASITAKSEKMALSPCVAKGGLRSSSSSSSSA